MRPIDPAAFVPTAPGIPMIDISATQPAYKQVLGIARLLAMVAMVHLAFATFSIGTYAGGTSPNIILVMTDDQGYGQMGAHGHPWLRTPNLDSLHVQSTRFTRFHVSPTCSPTRAALLTGRYPFQNGITHTILERERMTLQATTVAQLLKKQGYRTGIFGKWHLGDELEYQPENRGFDEVFIHGAGGIGQAYPGSCADAPGNSYFDPALRHNGSFVKTSGFCTDIFFTQAMGWMKQQSQTEQPFFAYITTNAPHGPFIAPPSNTKRFTDRGFKPNQAGFYGMIENIDENMGRLIANLDQWKLAENTLLIFMSDNGTTGGGPGNGVVGHRDDGSPMMFYNAGMKGMKGSVYEGGTRVPFLLRWPGEFPAGLEIDTLAGHIDILPTLVDIAGGTVPSDLGVEGRSLLPLIQDPNAVWPERHLFFHVGRWAKKGVEGRWGKGAAGPDESKYRNFSVRGQRFRFANGTELYDLQNDPGETENVIAEYPDVVDEMKQAYERWWDKVRPGMVNEDVPLASERPYHRWYEDQLNSGGIPDWKAPE